MGTEESCPVTCAADVTDCPTDAVQVGQVETAIAASPAQHKSRRTVCSGEEAKGSRTGHGRLGDANNFKPVALTI